MISNKIISSFYVTEGHMVGLSFIRFSNRKGAKHIPKSEMITRPCFYDSPKTTSSTQNHEENRTNEISSGDPQVQMLKHCNPLVQVTLYIYI